jgi:hypothetical protein
MAIDTDISVASNGNIRYTGSAHGTAGAGYYTVIEFHRWLQDLADNASASGDDLLDITNDTPSERSTDNIITLYNPYNIDDTLAEHLYDGSIIQKDGDEIYDGIVNFGKEGIHIELMQNGSLISNDFWNTTPNGETTEGLNRDTSAGISHRFMVKVRTGGSDIDGRRLIGLNREFGFTYGEFSINGTSRGNNVLALTHSTDLNNQTSETTVSGWTSITNTEGYTGIDVTGDGVDEYYYSKWDTSTYSINQFYERTKYLSRRGSTSTLYGLNGNIFRGITHEIDVDNASGTFQAVEDVSWTGGTGQMFAIDSTTSPTKMWIQLLTGSAPGDNVTITGGTSSATCQVNVNVIERPVSKPFVGASTGSAIIGSYGLGIETDDLSASDKLFDLTNTQRIPPNNVTFTVYGLVSSEDRVLVAPEDGGGIDYDQLSLNGALSSGGTTVTISGSIPSDTPSSGTIRVWDGTIYTRVTYSAWSGSSFTGCSNVPNASDGANVWISYIDKLADASSVSFTGVYASDRSLFIRVRDGGSSPIKTFETTGTLGSSGGSATAIRTSDD